MGHFHKKKYPISEECSRNIIGDLKIIRDELSQSSDPKSAYLAKEMLRKYADPDPELAKLRQQAAIEKWLNVDTCNQTTNLRLYLPSDHLIDGVEADIYIARAARLIRNVIGDTPPLDLFGSFSGGASTSLRRTVGMVERKYSGKLDVTQEAWDHIWPILYRTPVWYTHNKEALLPNFVVSSVMFTVPKTDTIDRVACKEPDLNMWMQKACGDFIRRRLKSRCSIDLNDQSINKNLARTAVARNNATVDLSSASDSVTTQLVCRLLPTGWFVFLDNIRVHSTILLDGTIHELEMFSSMGNGFTFELESLIFWALSRSVCDYRDTVSVYGDDIIISASRYETLVELFTYCGFTINREKSFANGLFRESCGGHYWDGRDITPFYVKKPIRSVKDLINLLNSIRRWSRHSYTSTWCDDIFSSFWKKYASLVPRSLHGGRDLSSTETLASPVGKGYRLVQCKRSVKSDWVERGSYILWHAGAGSTPSKAAHAVMQELLECRILPNTTMAYFSLRDFPYFNFEVEYDTPA